MALVLEVKPLLFAFQIKHGNKHINTKIKMDSQIIKRIERSEFDPSEDVHISHAIIDTIDFRFSSFSHNVHIENCIIGELLIYSTFFEGGFVLENCIISKYTNYEMGGPNKFPFVIRNNVFCDIFQFFDCIFENELTIKNNVFCKGASIYNRSNTFSDFTQITDNNGALDLYITLE